jgi:hypothetical protein
VTSQKSPQLPVSNKFDLADSNGSDRTSIEYLFNCVSDVILRNCERGYSFPEFIVCGGGMLAFSAFLFSVEIAKGRVQAYGNAYLFPAFISVVENSRGN